MATTDVSLHAESRQPEQKPVVNNMSIQVATVNGSGSQSSNTVLLRSIFRWESRFPVKICSLEHRRAAHLVHHSRQQRWIHRAQKRN